jgi:hypothetical protein
MKLRACNREISPSESQNGMVIDLVGTRVGSTGRKAAHVPVCANERSKTPFPPKPRIRERHRSTDSAVTAVIDLGFSFQSLVPRYEVSPESGFGCISDSTPATADVARERVAAALALVDRTFILSLLRANQAVAAISMYNCLAAACFFSTLILAGATAVRAFRNRRFFVDANLFVAFLAVKYSAFLSLLTCMCCHAQSSFRVNLLFRHPLGGMRRA